MPERSRAYPARLGSRSILDGLGLMLCFAGLVATVSHFPDRVNNYDEGILLTNAFLLGEGAAPYRDFYSNYPPGGFVLILAAWKVLGVSISATRLLGFFMHVMLAAGMGRLAGRAADRRFSWLAAGLTLLWTSPLGVIPFAWIAALALSCWALNTVVSVSVSADRRPITALLAGVLLGAVSLLRHDLFVYLVLAITAVLVLAALRVQTRHALRSLSPGWMAAGVMIALLVGWLPTVIAAGPSRVIGDLYLDLVRHVMPARRLPFTSLGMATPTLWLSSLAFCLAGPVLGIGLAFGSRDKWNQLVATLALGVLALAVLPQMLGRADYFHTLYSIAPGLGLYALVCERMAGQESRSRSVLGAAAAALLLVLCWGLLPRPSQWTALPTLTLNQRAGGMPAYQYEWKRPVLDFIRAHTSPGDAIFVGNEQHRRVTFNDLSLYYLAERKGATRYMQFDPGLVTREDVQQEMVRELEANRTKVIVLLLGGYSPEPNDSRLEGSGILDDYIASRYRVADSAGVYRMLLRSGVENSKISSP